MSEKFQFKPTQKFRVISGDISFRTTAREIRKGVGDFGKFNLAVLTCLTSLEKQKSGASWQAQCVSGLAGAWEGFQIQLDVAA